MQPVSPMPNQLSICRRLPEMLKFLVDTQLPPVLATFLRRKGYDAIHTTHFPHGHLLTDGQIETIAIGEGRIIITKDNDFPESYFKKGTPPRVLHLALGNIRNNELIDLLDQQISAIEQYFNEGAEMVAISSSQIIIY